MRRFLLFEKAAILLEPFPSHQFVETTRAGQSHIRRAKLVQQAVTDARATGLSHRAGSHLDIVPVSG